MAGVKGRSGGARPNTGGARPGAGRPRKHPQGLVIDVVAATKPKASDAKVAAKPEPSDDEFEQMIAPPAKAKQKTDQQVRGDKALNERLELMAKMAEVPLPQTDDPKEFLTAVMNHPGVDGKLRIDAARTLLPFTHAKLAEQGKKVERANAAKEAGAGKFAAAQPPKLALVGGR